MKKLRENYPDMWEITLQSKGVEYPHLMIKASLSIWVKE